ncbi:hypothetical protein CRENBAI_019190 [Crenichthys baileyi]|uniref:Pyrin domain-containing protein n=1 Tax=Crenichthys baileyi TaxID=28760 RepID=A0AAV9REX6_9TELE
MRAPKLPKRGDRGRFGVTPNPYEELHLVTNPVCGVHGQDIKDLKQWLKETLEDLDSKELKYFHWFLHTADTSKDGFKPIKKSRLEHADRLDTVDLMFQIYTTKTREVAENILKKMNKNKGQDFRDGLLDILEDLDDRELRYFHWYLYSADKSKDGFKAIKKSRLEGADRLDTVELMAQTYAANTKEVTKKILEKIESSKGLSGRNKTTSTVKVFHWNNLDDSFQQRM